MGDTADGVKDIFNIINLNTNKHDQQQSTKKNDPFSNFVDKHLAIAWKAVNSLGSMMFEMLISLNQRLQIIDALKNNFIGKEDTHNNTHEDDINGGK